MESEWTRERKPIDPELRRLLDTQAIAAGAPTPVTDQERAHMIRTMMVRAVESRSSIAGLPNAVTTRDQEIAPGLTVRLYMPDGGQTPRPVLVYLHGGGWVSGSIATLDPFCRLLSEAGQVSIVSVEYRLAPEHLYPAALEDALAAYGWAADHTAEWGGHAEMLLLGGDSAGANLAATAAYRLHQAGDAHALRGLMLLSPVTDHPSAEHPSYTENQTGYGLDANAMQWFWRQYAPGISPEDPGVSPLRWKEVPALPPTLVTTAEYDVLRDEGIAFAEKLQQAGIAVTHLHAPDMHHNFAATPGTVGMFPQGEVVIREIAAWMSRVLGMAEPAR